MGSTCSKIDTSNFNSQKKKKRKHPNSKANSFQPTPNFRRQSSPSRPNSRRNIMSNIPDNIQLLSHDDDDDDIKLKGLDDIQLLYKGNNSKIYRACKDGIPYAIKECNLIDPNSPEYLANNGNVPDPSDEAMFMKILDNPNIVRFFDSMIDRKNQKLFILMEYCSNGTIDRNPNPNMKRLFLQILNAVEYLHSNRIAHRDIKPSNILLDSNHSAKLADFGTAIYVPRNDNMVPITFAGTVSYFAPEIFNNAKCNPFASDVWALGVTFYQLSFGLLPFKGKTLEEKAKNIKEKEPFFPEYADKDLIDLIKQMLCKDPEKRITINDIWYHPYMQRITVSPSKIPSQTFNSLRIKKNIHFINSCL